jgi:hypothetical protein
VKWGEPAGRWRGPMNRLKLCRREGMLWQQIGVIILLRSTCKQTGYASGHLLLVSVGRAVQASRV